MNVDARLGVVCTLLLALWIATVSSPALAQAGSQEREHSTEGSEGVEAAGASAQSVAPARDWYGYQTLLVDAFGYAMFAWGVGADEGLLGWAGVLTLSVGSPLVHAVHGNSSAAQPSLGLRLLAGVTVIAGAMLCVVGLLGSGEGDSNDAACAVFVVGLVAFPVMTLVDAVVLAREPSAGGRAHVTPWIDVERGAGGLALRGHL